MLLPDGRHLAYQDQGVSAEKATFSIIASHAFLSSRLTGTNILLSNSFKKILIPSVCYWYSDTPSLEVEISFTIFVLTGIPGIKISVMQESVFAW